MKQFGKIFFAVAIAAVVLTPAAFAQSTAAATATASATIVPGITITKTADLAFGDMLEATTAAGGTVTVDNADTRTSSNVTTVGGTVTSAKFDITGRPNTQFSILLPGTITLAGPTASDTMTVDTFTSNPTTPGTIVPPGTATLAVGATLHVAKPQAVGNYSTTFNVTVSYL